MKYPICSASELARGLLCRLRPSQRRLRLLAYFSCVSLGLLLLAARGLYAASREDAFNFGHELIGLSDLTRGAETLTLNGERFHHSLVVSAEPLGTVLDRVVDHCQKNPGPAARAIDEVAARARTRFERLAPPGALRHAVFREESATRGMVLCFVGGPEFGSALSWLSAVRRFSSTRDLSVFGRLRYSFAERTEHGRTRVVSLWADTGLNLTTLFPATGDAAGTDSTVLPRPPAARRTLSAGAEGMPFAVRSYESSQSVAAAQHFYDAWLTQHGFRVAHDVDSNSSSYLRADGYQAFLSLMQTDGHTYITVTETGRVDALSSLDLGSEP